MIRREQLRLRRTIRRLLLASLAWPAVQACSSDKAGGFGAEGPDASVPDGGIDDAGVDSSFPDAGRQDSASVADAGADVGSCEASLPYVSDASYFTYDSGSAAICYYFVDLPCGYQRKYGTSGCYWFLADCARVCDAVDGGFVDCLYVQGEGCDDASVTVDAGDPASVACGVCNGVGRRPAGLRPPHTWAHTPAGDATSVASIVGRYFAQVAHLEAASVAAFERLRDELLAHGAPPELVRTAERSARDEVRHARVTARIARRFGGDVCAPRVRRGRVRTLERIARENAVEGCVRETFGAVIATWQALHAVDPRVRRSMRRIARDETRHAALAWAVARWAETRLDARAQARVARARRAAVGALAGDLSTELPAAAAREAGLPSVRQARELLAGMSELWT